MKIRPAIRTGTPPSRRIPRPAITGIWALVLVLAVALSGCSGSSVNRHPTMTQQQAAAHAEQIMRDTADALTPRPTLEIYQPGSTTSACLDDTNPQSAQGLVVVSRTYWLRGIPHTSNTAIGEQVLRLWKQKGWVINSTKGIGTSEPQITGIARPYAFGINLEWSSDGSLSIQASSVCIWPNGTPPAKS